MYQTFMVAIVTKPASQATVLYGYDSGIQHGPLIAGNHFDYSPGSPDQMAVEKG